MARRTHIGSTLALLLVGGLGGACGPAVVPPPLPTLTPSPQATPSRSISAADLSGKWVFGSENEPAPGPVVGCYPSKLWNLKQQGTEVKGDVDACVGPCAAFTEATTGQNAQGHVTLTGTAQESPGAGRVPVSYDMTFQPRTGHLVGTRNGAPFWAAPFVQRSPADCGPAPL